MLAELEEPPEGHRGAAVGHVEAGRPQDPRAGPVDLVPAPGEVAAGHLEQQRVDPEPVPPVVRTRQARTAGDGRG